MKRQPRNTPIVIFLLLTTVALLTVRTQSAADNVPAVRLVSYSETKPILEGLRSDLLPAELRTKTPTEQEALWADWASGHDREIRARLARGDEDSILNFLLFGSSFTKLPRATNRDLATLEGRLSRDELIDGRIANLITALAAPNPNERVQFARRVLATNGIAPETAAGAAQARRYFLEGLERMSKEIEELERRREKAQRANNTTAETVERSTRFYRRGLSSDTSILSSFGIERALATIASKRTLGPTGARRAAIIGPGLDFVDKRDGYDFYPLQTIQPFALEDALIRHGLAKADDLRVTTLDLSPQINQHIESASQRARDGHSYTLQLPRDLGLPWTPGLLAYWQRFGASIGAPTTPLAAPEAGGPEVRAVRVRPAMVRSITPRDVNIVVQRFAPLAGDQQFDLVIATDVLIYYDVFEQALALANVASMLRPQGLLLTNIALLELPSIPMTHVGHTDVVYLGDPELGDRFYLYQRQ